MKEKYIQTIGILITAIYGVFIIFLYAAEPRSLAEVTEKAVTTVETITTKGTVVIGTYQVDPELSAQALAMFRQGSFPAARDLFERADPEKRDPATQYYIAYSYYRQGWGRVSNDDALFKQALETLDRLKSLDPNFRSTDADLKLQLPAELRAEIEEGLKVTADDFNPFKIFRERK